MFESNINKITNNSNLCKGNNQSEVFNLSHFIDVLKDNQDDEFFHLTCHVDAAIRQKIIDGHFIELERLLPKARSQIMDEDQ